MIENISFHEATVIEFCKYNSTIKLRLDDVVIEGVKEKATLEISPVASLTVDGEISDMVSMLADDGEVLSLEYSNSSISVIVEWHDFVKGFEVTKSYYVTGRDVLVTID